MQSLCELDILTHGALISYINGLLQVNDQLCKGPFARNMDRVRKKQKRKEAGKAGAPVVEELITERSGCRDSHLAV